MILAATWPQNENARRLLRDTISDLGHTVPFIVLLGPPISYQAVVPRILAHRALRGLDSNLQSYLGKGLFEFDKKMATDFPDTDGFSFVSVLQSVCPEGNCPTLLNGSVPLQWDTFHLTAPGSEYIVSKIWPKVALRGSALRPNGP